MFKILTPASALLLVAATAAHAQDAQRYQLEKTENGYVRLDLQTGEMSVCEDTATQLVCRAAVEERAATTDASGDAERLRQLERRVAALERAAGGKDPANSEEEFEQGLDRMESFFRRFMGLAREFEQEPSEPMPDRT